MSVVLGDRQRGRGCAAGSGMTSPGNRLSNSATTSNPPSHRFILLCISVPPSDWTVLFISTPLPPLLGDQRAIHESPLRDTLKLPAAFRCTVSPPLSRSVIASHSPSRARRRRGNLTFLASSSSVLDFHLRYRVVRTHQSPPHPTASALRFRRPAR